MKQSEDFGDISHPNHKSLRLLSNCIMKLRIRGNSIRLRLTRGEVDQLAVSGRIENMLQFGLTSPELRYELSATAEDNETRAKFEDYCLSISIPSSVAKTWIRSDKVGIEEMQPIGDQKFLRILVEKDFACLSERDGEDDTDTFPNPFLHDQDELRERRG